MFYFFFCSTNKIPNQLKQSMFSIPAVKISDIEYAVLEWFFSHSSDIQSTYLCKVRTQIKKKTFFQVYCIMLLCLGKKFLFWLTLDFLGLPQWCSDKESACQYRRYRFDAWVKIFWSRKWQPAPVFLPGKPPWTERPGRLHTVHGGTEESDMAQRLKQLQRQHFIKSL